MSDSTGARFLASSGGRAGLVVLLLLAGAAIVAPRFGSIRSSGEEPSLAERFAAPSPVHPFGTDDLGRDVLARMAIAAPVSLEIGLLSALLSLAIGVAVGGIAGYFGGAVDAVASRAIEVVLCFPTIVVILAFVAFLPPSAASVILAIGVTSWPEEARYTRAEVLKARTSPYVDAARVAGEGPLRIFAVELLPNVLAPVLVSAAFGAADAVLAESALSFLGLGVPAPAVSWGGILALAPGNLEIAWWLALFPGLAIFATVASYNLIGEAWRESLNVAGTVPPALPRVKEAIG